MTDDGLEPYEMKSRILETIDTFKGWVGLEEETGRYLNLVVLEAEQEDF